MGRNIPPIGNKRILIVDDNVSIHEDFRKILLNPDKGERDTRLNEMEQILFQSDPACCPEGLPIRFEIDDAFQGIEAVEKVQQAETMRNPYAMIFMDVRMPPGIDGIEAMERIWAIDPDVEIVICTAYSDYSWEEIVRRLGASDRMLFLKKPFYSVEVKQMALSLVIKRNLNEQVKAMIADLERQVEERTGQLREAFSKLEEYNRELQEKNRILADMAERDGLTGLYNHTALHRRLDEIFEAANRNRFPVSVIMMDVDNFKFFNDHYGHRAGDEILSSLASALKTEFNTALICGEGEDGHNELRKYDVVARYGGDEFVIILPYCGEADAAKVADRLMRRLKEVQLRHSRKTELTVSMGVAVTGEGPIVKGLKELLYLADQALYQSKTQGKDRVTILRHPDKNGNG